MPSIDPDTALSAIDPTHHRRDVALAASGLGVFEYDATARAVHLDRRALVHFALSESLDGWLGEGEWLGRLGRDAARLRTALAAGVPPGETRQLSIGLTDTTAATGTVLRTLELNLSAGSQGRLVGVSRDITQENSREEMRRQKLAAERANRSKSEFMSQVSHELRTPLNAILGFAQLMAMDQEAPLAGVQRDRLDVLQHSGRRLLGLIDQLLQIGRIEQGKRDLKPRSVNVAAAVGRCVDTLHVMAIERGVEIAVEIERAHTASVRADVDALEQVLTNLLSNAIKYNREHGRVRVRFRAEDSVGQVIIDDTGTGLTQSQIGRLFEPFNRLNAGKTDIQGTGLGLVITRQLVQAMGGRLEVRSELGRGSRFSVHLPLGQPVQAPQPTDSLPLELPSRWDTGFEHSVLYIEDDDVNIVLMEQLFSTQPDWRLHIAGTGAEGLAMARRQQPQLILLDMNLPDLSGEEVFKELRGSRLTREIPCVAVSADALPEQVARARAAGFEDYWTKPLDLPEVVNRLKRLLR